MLRTNYEHAEEDKKILSLTPLQNVQIIRQLVNSNPSAREAILASVPFLPPHPTRSRFFASEVEELVPVLSGKRWNGHFGCFTFIRYAINSMVERMKVDFHVAINSLFGEGLLWYERLNAIHGPEKSTRLNYADGSRDDYFMDLCIAIMDVDLLMYQRIPFAKPENRFRNEDYFVQCVERAIIRSVSQA